MSKITVIYAHEEGEQWSTPMALINEFEERGWEVEIVSIGSNRRANYHSSNLKTWIDSSPESDIVLFMDWGRFESPLLDKGLVDAFWIQESGDDPQNFQRNFPKANKFHITLTPDYSTMIEYKNKGIDAYWWTHFADTRIQYPLDEVPEFVATTTRGLGGSEFLDILTEHSHGAVGNQRGFDGVEHSRFLQRGLMVVQNSRWGEVTRRIFEAMACGKMVLTDRLSDERKLHELFEDGKEIVFYDDIVDCINKMNYYKEHEEEREQIAKNGREKVLENHTQKQRVDFIIEKWKEYEQRKI